MQSAELEINKIRKDFPILTRKINGKPFVYLDNAATTQKPLSVINKISEYYSFYNSNIVMALIINRMYDKLNYLSLCVQ